MKPFKTALVGVACLAVFGVANAADITGAGSTFAAPIYGKWADAYQKAGLGKVNYQGIGSAGGIKQIEANTVDFAGSDAPLTDDDLAKNGLVQFPTVVGGVVPAINLPGIKAGELVLDGQTLGDIYLGKITKWNDPAIAKLNPGVKLPSTDVAVVRRSDGSGTTFIFTDYLSKVNADWKSKLGEGTTVNWPVGVGGQGNAGVAAFVQRLPGAIGYIEYAYLKQNKMTYVKMKNADGAVVSPDVAAFKAAAAGADWSKTYYQVLTNEPGKGAWPILGATFVMMHTKQDKPEQGAAVLKFFDWSFKNGNQAAVDLDYVTLPESVIKQIRATWKSSVKDASGNSIAY